jgi:hypothetical protein
LTKLLAHWLIVVAVIVVASIIGAIWEQYDLRR